MKLDKLTRNLAEEFDVDLSQLEFEGAIKAVIIIYASEQGLMDPKVEHRWIARRYNSSFNPEDRERFEGYSQMKNVLYENAVNISERA